MNILIVGSGGREHALAWKAARSNQAEKVFVAPGNAGTAQEPGVENIDIGSNDIDAFVHLLDDSGSPVHGHPGLVLARRGKFRIQGGNPGVYHLRFFKPGYRGILRRIEVKDGVNPMVRVELE